MRDQNEAAKTSGSKTEEDLSAEIARTVSKTTREQVTCRRVKEDHYRCNWWMPQSLSGYDNPAMAGLMVTTNRICRSSFLRVKRAASGGLEITDISGGRASR